MNDLKLCKKCNCVKFSRKDFYTCKGRERSECKSCTIRQNIYYQKRMKGEMYSDKKRSYSVAYYAKNKEKFAEYRKKFKEKHPEYYKKYSGKLKVYKLSENHIN